METASRVCFEAGLRNCVKLWDMVYDFSEPLHFDIIAYVTEFNEILRQMRHLSDT